MNVAQDKTVDLMRRPAVDVSALLRGVIGRSGEKSEAVGREVGYEPTYWTRVLSCERGLTLDRLGRLPVEVQRALIVAWAEQLELRIERRRRPGEAEVAELADLIATRKVRITLEAVA